MVDYLGSVPLTDTDGTAVNSTCSVIVHCSTGTGFRTAHPVPASTHYWNINPVGHIAFLRVNKNEY